MNPQVYCQYCGAPHNTDAAFCPRCGRPTGAQGGSTQPSPYQQQRPAPPAPNYAPVPPVPSYGHVPPVPPMPPARSSSSTLLIVLGVLVFLGLGMIIAGALLFGVSTSRSGGMPAAQPTGVPAAVITEGAAPSLVPPVPVGPAANMVYNGTSFYLDQTVAAGASAQTPAAVPPSPDSVPWEVMPAHDEISLNGYVLWNTFHQPKIMIIPVDAYTAMDDNVAASINQLKTLLAARPASVNGAIPRLPFWNAGEVFHAKLRYIDFAGGSGIGYLCQYAQGIVPINNYELFYSFQGLTSDGRWLISAVLPVSHPDLPANINLSQAEYDSLLNDYAAYLESAVADLNAKADNSFTPSLEKLDELFRSLSVQK